MDFGNGPVSYVAVLNQDSTGIYRNGLKIDTEFILDENWLKIRPDDFLHPNDSFEIFVKGGYF